MKGYCSLRNSAQKWKTAHGPLAQNSLYAPGREVARSRIRPAAERPQNTHLVPGRHAAREGNQPTGPLTLSASRAPGRNLGLGRESFFPPGLKLGPVIMSRPSQSDGYARIPAEQNRLRRPRANPRVHLRHLAPRRAPQLAAERLRRPTSTSGESAPEAPP
jgi:hypothetical protein